MVAPGHPGFLALGLWMGLLALPAVSEAAAVRFPLTVEYDLLKAALRKHLREESSGELVFWRSADGCRTFTMREPVVEPAQGRLKVAGPASVQVGLGLFGYCFASVGWDGYVEIMTRPEIGRDWQIRLHVLDTQLYDANRQRMTVATRVWETVRGWAEQALPTFAFDLGPPVQELKSVLALFAGSARGRPLAAAIQSLQPVDVTVEPDGIKVGVTIQLPPAPPTPRAPEPALSPAQLKRWETALESWDGFLTFVVKDLGTVHPDPQVRQELLDVLLGARHDLVAVLERGPEPGTADPVQQLFVTVWNRLRAIVRQAGTQAGDDGRTLRYLTFLAAGDALTTLMAAAPALGLEISVDGLRRLARTLDPAHAGDPLDYSEAPDATLRHLFRFRDPDAPPRRGRKPPPGSWQWLGPRAAHAAEVDGWVQVGQRLDRWVPGQSELSDYRNTVDYLLTLAAERTFDPAEADARFERLFDHLVKATAWQESCWRQFVRKRGVVTYLVSRTNDVGLMQINARIWRGFFNVERLRWNAAYNAGAGAEILYNLLLRYGVREAGEHLDNAARSTYSAYNGGPARYRRYRLARVPDFVRAIDRGFWEKYQLVAAGNAQDRVLCMPIGAAASSG